MCIRDRGGAEDKGTDLEKGIVERNRLNFFELGILKNIISLTGVTDPTVEVVTTASSIPDEVAENYIDAFSKLGCNKIGHLRIRDREMCIRDRSFPPLCGHAGFYPA